MHKAFVVFFMAMKVEMVAGVEITKLKCIRREKSGCKNEEEVREKGHRVGRQPRECRFGEGM